MQGNKFDEIFRKSDEIWRFLTATMGAGFFNN